MDRQSTIRPSAAGDAAPRTGRILCVKAGYNPNSSSLGTIIFAVPAAMIVAPAVYNAIAAALTSATLRDKPEPHGLQSLPADQRPDCDKGSAGQ